MLRYRSEAACIEVELVAAIKGDFFHLEMRRLISGQPASYRDRVNCLSHYEIALLCERESYEWEKYSYYCAGWQKVMQNTASLLMKNSDLLRGRTWFDRQQLNDIKIREFISIFKVRPKSNNLIEDIQHQAAFLVENHGFHLVFTTADLPPYEQGGDIMLRYERNGQALEITCPDIQDWKWEIRLNSASKVVRLQAFFDQLEEELQKVRVLL